MVQEQSSRIERRLSAEHRPPDAAGYSRLMGLDEVGTARILREHRVVSDGLVAKHGGRIVKTTGDGVLLEFSSGGRRGRMRGSRADGDGQRNDAIPADRRMLFRMGINLGDILIQGDDSRPNPFI